MREAQTPAQTAEHPGDAILSARYDALHPFARLYADNLKRQILQLFRQYQTQSYAQFKQRTSEKSAAIPAATIEQVQALLLELRDVTIHEHLPRKAYDCSIEGANNPYAQVYLANAMTYDREVTLSFNLLDRIASDRTQYRSLRLTAWSRALSGIEDAIRISPEQWKILHDELKEGSFPIIMPSSTVQLNSIQQGIDSLRPVWIPKKAVRTMEPTKLMEIAKEYIESKEPSIVAESPDTPYILLVRHADQQPIATERNTVADQRKIVQRFQKLFPGIGAITLPEYIALQTLYTRGVYHHMKESGVAFKEIHPFDAEPEVKFIFQNTSDDGWILVGYPSATRERLVINSCNPESWRSDQGFLFCRRIPLVEHK